MKSRACFIHLAGKRYEFINYFAKTYNKKSVTVQEHWRQFIDQTRCVLLIDLKNTRIVYRALSKSRGHLPIASRICVQMCSLRTAAVLIRCQEKQEDST